MPRAKLTIKQDKFAREYVKDGNGTRAAKAAGYSANCPAEIAYENLNEHHIAAEVKRHRLRVAEKLDTSAEKLVQDSLHDAETASIQGDWSAATACRTFAAKTLGYHVDKSMRVNVDVN